MTTGTGSNVTGKIWPIVNSPQVGFLFKMFMLMVKSSKLSTKSILNRIGKYLITIYQTPLVYNNLNSIVFRQSSVFMGHITIYTLFV